MQQTENSDSTQLPDTSYQSPSLIDYLQVIARRRRMIFFVTLGAAVISVVYSLILPNIYAAKTLILPAQEDKGLANAMMAQLGGLASLAGASLGGANTTDLYVSMLRSEAIKDPIIERFKLKNIYKNKYLSDTYKTLDTNAVISAGKKDGIITITVNDKDPKRAADMANAYAEELGKLTVRLNIAGAGKNRSFLEERLSGAKADLARAEEALKVFQSKNKAVQVTAQAEAAIKGIAEMRAQLAAQEVQLATARRQLTESSQEVKNLVTSVNNLRSQIARLEGSGGSNSIPSVGSVPAIGQEYVRLMREFKIQESLVELLTKQYEMARFSESKDVSPFQVLQNAKVPERKSKPARARMVIMATFSALFFSLIMAFVMDNFSRMPEENRERWKSLRAGLTFLRKPEVG